MRPQNKSVMLLTHCWLLMRSDKTAWQKRACHSHAISHAMSQSLAEKTGQWSHSQAVSDGPGMICNETV